MLVDNNRGWTRGPFRDHNSEVVCMRVFNCTQREGVNGHHVEL